MGGSRERFFTTARHKRPDRVPMDLWARPEIVRQLRERLGTAQIEEALGTDFAHVDLPDRFPEFDRRASEPKGGDWPGAGGRYVWHDERTFQDPWGIIRRVGSDGKLVEWISGPFAETTDLAGYAFPPTRCLPEPSEIAGHIAQLKAADRVVCTEVTMPFKRAWQMRGLENLLCDMLTDIEFVEALYDRIYTFETERADRAAHAGADVIQVVGDIAMEDRLLFKPEIFRELDVPRL